MTERMPKVKCASARAMYVSRSCGCWWARWRAERARIRCKRKGKEKDQLTRWDCQRFWGSEVRIVLWVERV